MGATSLRQELESFFLAALETARGHSDLRTLLKSLGTSREMLWNRMRVAFIGGVNNGKSTLMNAFLREKLAETGNRELTWNVTWFQYGERPELRVHTTDGKIEEETFTSLAALTTRCDQNQGLLDRIRYVEVRYPSELLRKFDLIDTPGLYSSHRKDSDNTKRFLTDEATRPHALVFLFSDTLKEHDIRELDAFHHLNGGSVTGVNAICALTKADAFPQGLETARRVIEQVIQDYPWTRRRFYTILPVMGQPAFGARTLSPDEEVTLCALACLPPQQTHKMLLDARWFATKEYPEETAIPPPAARRAVHERLGVWGIRFVLDCLRNGQSMDKTKSALLEATKVEQLREIVESHFGNRSLLIQATGVLNGIRDEAFYLAERLQGAAQVSAYRIVKEIDRIRSNEPRFREFGILEKYYTENIALSEQELEQLLNVTGERGSSCAQRLGVPSESPPEELIALAASSEAYWRSRSSEYWASEDLKEVARVLSESYGEIHARVLEAAGHLRTASELLDWRD